MRLGSNNKYNHFMMVYYRDYYVKNMDVIEEDIKTIIEQVGLPMYDFEGKEILISGACGFLGSWFIAVFQTLNQSYFKKPCKVYAVDSFIASDSENSLITITDKNILFRKDKIEDMKMEGSIDYIIHAAGIASPVYYRKYPIETIDGMVFGLRNLLNFAVKNPVKSFLYFSSSEIYGNPHPSSVPTKEEYYGNVSCIGPRSCYDESKRMGEAMCASYHRIYNIPVKWVRPFNISGPGMRRADDRVLPKFVYAALQNESIVVHSPGGQTRTLCYVTDGMVGFFKALLIGKNGEVYNIGRHEEELSMRNLAQKILSVIPTQSKITTIPAPTEYPQDQALRRCPDISKAQEQLNYFPHVNLETIIERTAKWAKKNL